MKYNYLVKYRIEFFDEHGSSDMGGDTFTNLICELDEELIPLLIGDYYFSEYEIKFLLENYKAFFDGQPYGPFFKEPDLSLISISANLYSQDGYNCSAINIISIKKLESNEELLRVRSIIDAYNTL